MRSAIFHQFGNPTEVLAIADSPTPQPTKGQVRLRTVLAAVHNHDLLIISGQYGYKPSLPAIAGSEAVGVIDALGEGVTGLVVGQRVAVAGVSGTWAEYFIAPAHQVVPLPSTIEDEAAAQLLSMPLSALMLLEFLQVKSGEWIIQNTANGAVGKALAMLARGRGINVVNLVRRDAGVVELQAFGIDNVVSTEQLGWADRVRAVTAGAPIVAAVDSIGGEATDELAGMLAQGGLLVSFGVMGGNDQVGLSTSKLIFKELTVKGFWGSKVAANTSPEDMRRLIGELLTQTSNGQLRLHVDQIVNLGEIAKVAAANSMSGRKGKVLIKP